MDQHKYWRRNRGSRIIIWQPKQWVVPMSQLYFMNNYYLYHFCWFYIPYLLKWQRDRGRETTGSDVPCKKKKAGPGLIQETRALYLIGMSGIQLLHRSLDISQGLSLAKFSDQEQSQDSIPHLIYITTCSVTTMSNAKFQPIMPNMSIIFRRTFIFLAFTRFSTEKLACVTAYLQVYLHSAWNILSPLMNQFFYIHWKSPQLIISSL